MAWSQVRSQNPRGLRWAASLAVAAALALPSVPAAAQPEVQTSPIASTPADCSIRLSVANPTPGDQEIPRTLTMNGVARDQTATSGVGISQIQAFLGDRNQGGTFIGATTFGSAPTMIPGAWSLTTTMPPNISGGQTLFVYGTSSVTGQQAFVSIPIGLAGTVPEIMVSDQAGSFCPAIMTPGTPAGGPSVTPTPVPTPQIPTPPLPANPPVPAAPPAATSVQLTISSPASPPLTFSTNMLTAPAGAQVTVTYNNDSPIPHNWNVFNGPDANASSLAETRIMTGPGASDSVTFTAPTQPGSYFFRCDVHPTIMTGTFEVA